VKKRRIAKIRATLLGFLLAVISFVPAQSAMAVTCGTLGNYFDGYYHNASTHSDTFEGASGFITNRYNSVCDTDTTGPNPSNNTIGNNFTTAWVMIADYSGDSWSQAGVIRGYNTPQYVWAEVVRNNDGSPYIRYDRFLGSGGLNDGTRNSYYETWSINCLCTQSKQGSSVITNTNFNPFSYWNSGGYSPPRWSPQYSGEKTYQASNILGDTAHHVKFESIGVQRFSDNQLVLEPCTLSFIGTASRSSHDADGCHDFDIWTSS
jgi:hypothetical protein